MRNQQYFKIITRLVWIEETSLQLPLQLYLNETKVI